MNVGPAGHDAVAQIAELEGEGPGILHNLVPVLNEISSETLLQGNSDRLKFSLITCQ